ncbi:MAG: XkdF-like putative serine protease domain-containing protein [Methanothrix sp.]
MIVKADVERRLVYSVIAEPDTVDAQGDVMSAETIEEMAHNFLLRPRKFDNRHDWMELDAALSSHGFRGKLQCSWERGSRLNRGWSE